MSASARQARGTSQDDWVVGLPFDPNNPFGNGSLGVLMDTGAAGTPDPSTYRHLVSSGNYTTNEGGNAAADLAPIANPSNLGTGYYWWTGFVEKSDLCLIRPYQVLYTSSSHTALASAAAAAGITSTLSFWAVSRVGRAIRGSPIEYAADFIGQVTVTNAATRVNSGTKQLPTGAQFCDAATVIYDKSMSPGIRILSSGSGGTGAGTGGALNIAFDFLGGQSLLIRASGNTASAGVGWMRRHV